MKELYQYQINPDKNYYDSNLTIIANRIDYELLYEKLVDLFNKSKNINNPLKKHSLVSNYSKIINYLSIKYNVNNKINSVFLVGEDIEVKEYILNSKETETARTYNFKKIEIINDNEFKLDYILDLYHNFNFINAFFLDKKDVYFFRINNNKYIDIKINEDIIDYIKKIRLVDQYKDNIYLLFNEKDMKIKDLEKIDNATYYIGALANKYDLNKYHSDKLMKNNYKLLESRLYEAKNIEDKMDQYIFGKVKMYIENYMIKELFITEEKITNLRKKIDKDCFNFTIYLINSIEKGDIGDQFIKDYGGVLGVKYY
jgi:hypothetical protein